MTQTSLTLLFFPPLNPPLLAQEPHFVNLFGDTPLPQTQSSFSPQSPPSLPLEMLEREKTRASLRESNREMERLLVQLRIPKTDELTLKNSASLELMEPLHEMVIVLLPQDLNKLELRVSLPNLMLGDPFKVLVIPLSKKRKILPPEPIQPSGERKISCCGDPPPQPSN